jgi:hypothetical protein
MYMLCCTRLKHKREQSCNKKNRLLGCSTVWLWFEPNHAVLHPRRRYFFSHRRENLKSYQVVIILTGQNMYYLSKAELWNLVTCKKIYVFNSKLIRADMLEDSLITVIFMATLGLFCPLEEYIGLPIFKCGRPMLHFKKPFSELDCFPFGRTWYCHGNLEFRTVLIRLKIFCSSLILVFLIRSLLEDLLLEICCQICMQQMVRKHVNIIQATECRFTSSCFGKKIEPVSRGSCDTDLHWTIQRMKMA